DRLERQPRRTRTALAALAVLAVGAAWQAGTAAARPGEVLRLRGLVVEDAAGRPRILLGAPVPEVKERWRRDDMTGLLVPGEDGADRVAVGAPTPAPQSGGKVGQRIAEAAGLQIMDREGNERGGFGYLDNGRVVLGLDYPGREAVALFVMPEGYAGMLVSSDNEGGHERGGIVVDNKKGSAVIKLADRKNRERAMLLVEGESDAKLLLHDAKDGSYADALERLRTR
ncbi:MAG: hypothetical protein ACREIU_05900, partial [Planctomycetota bacterium]